MPLINADGCPIHVEVDGPERAPALMLSNSLGTTLNMWDRPQSVIRSIHSTAYRPLVTDWAMETWYHPSIA